MTKAQIAVLKAVRDGKCYRTYTASGNTMSGAHPATLHRLSAAHYIEDGKDGVTRFRLILTKKGEEALAAHPDRGGA